MEANEGGMTYTHRIRKALTFRRSQVAIERASYHKVSAVLRISIWRSRPEESRYFAIPHDRAFGRERTPQVPEPRHTRSHRGGVSRHPYQCLEFLDEDGVRDLAS